MDAGGGWKDVPLLVCLVLAFVSCDRPDHNATPTVDDLPDGTPLLPLTIHEPPSLTGLEIGATDHQGRPVQLECATCHSLRDGEELPENPGGLDAVHGGLVFDHGALSCASCHDAAHAAQLHLADGRPLEMVEAMTLCPAERNHCVDCHDPHSHAFPTYLPAAPPRDRFLHSAGHDDEGGHE